MIAQVSKSEANLSKRSDSSGVAKALKNQFKIITKDLQRSRDELQTGVPVTWLT